MKHRLRNIGGLRNRVNGHGAIINRFAQLIGYRRPLGRFPSLLAHLNSLRRLPAVLAVDALIGTLDGRTAALCGSFQNPLHGRVYPFSTLFCSYFAPVQFVGDPSQALASFP